MNDKEFALKLDEMIKSLDIEATKNSSNWIESTVSCDQDHFLLSFKKHITKDKYIYIPVARIGRWKLTKGQFPVEFIHSNISYVTTVKDNINYYLNELSKLRKAEDNFALIWEYQEYHCSTAANVYSDVRWTFKPEHLSHGISEKKSSTTSVIKQWFREYETDCIIVLGFILPYVISAISNGKPSFLINMMTYPLIIAGFIKQKDKGYYIFKQPARFIHRVLAAIYLVHLFLMSVHLIVSGLEQL